MNMNRRLAPAVAMAAMTFASASLAQNSIDEPSSDARAPNPLNNVYFGEQQLSYSTQRGIMLLI